jgi:hypothetical protein
MENSNFNLEPLKIFEFLLTVLFVSKAADPCVSSGWPYEDPYSGLGSLTNKSARMETHLWEVVHPAGSESCIKTEGHPLLTHRSAAFGTK